MCKLTSQTLRQRGFTLLEVLIAIIVLALGLLGLAKLQTAGLAANNIAYQRSQAAMLAYEGVDMVYADRENAWSRRGCYDVSFGSSDVRACAESPNHVVVPDWQSRIQATLPEGQGRIRITSASMGQTTLEMVEVTVCWRRWNNEDKWQATVDCDDDTKSFSYTVTSSI